MEFILTENPTTGYVWKYDETIIGDLFTVASTYKQDKSCKNHPIGCGGKRHFKVRGKEEGNGTLFTCNLQGSDPVRYDVMSNLLGTNCKEIKITVEQAHKIGMAQVASDSDKSYDLNKAMDVKSLEAVMLDLTIGQTFKI